MDNVIATARACGRDLHLHDEQMASGVGMLPHSPSGLATIWLDLRSIKTQLHRANVAWVLQPKLPGLLNFVYLSAQSPPVATPGGQIVNKSCS